ncbi:MAG: bifunctional phosphopantothenoylcysteine decarboxylase/phosphopantothenate--cysteine ligase CoaBC [Ignavibacteriae bacterium]|nr:bifunctional phosphopantothenoylcysteine decarboxylase/phosphopantothenate--cysteine ligase CoaBC [Ignavibacteriota bacterium]
MIPSVFNGKKIIVGITGGIAAYKTAFLIRDLVSNGAEVKVAVTPSALNFITPLTLSTLSQNDIIVNTFPDSNSSYSNTWHIDVATWADLMIIAPATINTVAKIVNGFADNALTTLVTALRCPLIIAPAADMDMYQNPITQKNIKTLTDLGYFVVEAEEGFLASGLTGKGRLADLSKILDAAEIVLKGYKKDLTGRKILVTAGPTQEDIDPVRFITNRSSGKMGYQIAKSAFLRGADVTLISGPSSEKIYPEIKKVNVKSADEMYKAVQQELEENEILIMSAAVADYTPAKKKSTKIKKEDNFQNIELTKTVDILSAVKKENKFIVGFALETDNEIEHAKKKLTQKGLDMIVLNSLREAGSGFEIDTNKITIINKRLDVTDLPLLTKFETANQILNQINKNL